MIFVIVEFHPLNDMIPEPDADIGVRLDVARGRGRAAAHNYPCHGAKPAGEVDFVGCSALDPGPAEPLAITGEGQIDAIGIGLRRTDAHEPAIARSSTRGVNNERDDGREKEGKDPPSRNPRQHGDAGGDALNVDLRNRSGIGRLPRACSVRLCRSSIFLERTPVIEVPKQQSKLVALTAFAPMDQQKPFYIFAAFVSTYGTTVLQDRLAPRFEWFGKAA